jgi:acetyl/propionyl-CoA carboxylase alpha subunit
MYLSSVANGRRLEVQVLADAHGNVVHLGERDCSIRRREQKLVEESPAPGLDPVLRERIVQVAVDAARAIGYRFIGTVEGVLEAGEFRVIGFNPRTEAQYCVTAMVTGIDVLREQELVAAGMPLSVTQADVWVRGHAIACRINAEDASDEITHYREPSGHFVRIDPGPGQPADDDPTIATLIVWARDRRSATRKMLRALAEYEIEGLDTLLPFHRELLGSEQWARGQV